LRLAINPHAQSASTTIIIRHASIGGGTFVLGRFPVGNTHHAARAGGSFTGALDIGVANISCGRAIFYGAVIILLAFNTAFFSGIVPA
jgi:hypothetical protein